MTDVYVKKFRTLIIDEFVILMHTLTCVSILVGILGFLFVDPGPYFDSTTFYGSLVLLSIFYATALFARKFEINVLDFFLCVSYLYIFPRLLQYYIAPELVHPPVPQYMVDEINTGLWTFNALLFLFFAGIIVMNLNKTENRRLLPELGQGKLLLAFAIFVALSALEVAYFGSKDNSIYSMSIYGKAAMPTSMKIFLTVASADFFMFIILYWSFAYIDSAKFRVRTAIFGFVILLLTIFLYQASAIIVGSRSGGFRILLMAIAFYLLLPRSGKRLGLVFFIFILGAFLNVATLPWAQDARAILTYGEKQSEVTSIQPDAAASEQLIQTDDPSKGDNSVYWLLNRLGYPDFLFITLARDPDQSCKDKYLSVAYFGKSISNFLLPGDPYPEAVVNSTNAFGPCYRGQTISERSRYHSEVWSMTGLAKIMTANWSYLICFFLGVLLGSISRFLGATRSIFGRITFVYWALLLPFGTIFMMGLDHTVRMYITISLRAAFAFGLLFLGSYIFSVYSARNKKEWDAVHG